MTREQFNTIKADLPKFAGRETKFRTVNKYTGKEESHTGVIIRPNTGDMAEHIILGWAGSTASVHFSRVDFPEPVKS